MRIRLLVVLALSVTLPEMPAHARSLVDQLDALVDEQLRISSQAHEAHFESSALTIQGQLVGQLSASAAELPAISTAPGFTYRYDPALAAPERVRGSLGPIFVDRAETVGRHRLDVGATYMFVDFTELDGDDLDGTTRTLTHADVFQGNGEPFNYVNDTITVRFDQFTLQEHVLSLFATYGLTERWDVNVLLPLIDTQLRVKAHASIKVTPGEGGTHLFDNNNTVKDVSLDADKTGVGDLLLRTKYRLSSGGIVGVATGLTLRVPTGEQEDFQGLGDVTLTPLLLLSREIGHHDLHLSLGMEANADDLDRSRARYGAGVTVGLGERFAIPIDVIGSSGLTEQTVSRRVPVFGTSPDTSDDIVDSREVSLGLRTDQVDLAVGLKANPFGRLVAFASAIVPLTTDGLRADVIPVGGIEWRF